MKIINKKEILEYLKSGLRLNTPAPRIQRDKSKYLRKEKHKRKDYE